MRRILVLLVASIAALGAFTRVRAQSDGKPLAFEVASLKPHAPGDVFQLHGFSPSVYKGGRLTATNVTVQNLIANAFRTTDRNLLPSQIVGGPNWITSSRFDIVATVGRSDMSMQEFNNQMPALMRSLLEDRFTLKTHADTRMLPVYALVKVRSDGRLGPQIRPSTIDCAALEKERANSPRPTIQELMSTARPCTTKGFRDSAGFTSDSITMWGIAGYVNGAVDRLVLDRTGLPGSFEATLQWANAMAASPGDATTGTAPLSDGPSVFTALQEQLGLKLESRQESVDVIVIDSVEHPTED